MDVQHRGHAGLDGSQELQELAAAVATMHLADDRPCGDVQGRKQRGGAMALVIMSAPLGDAGDRGKQRLCAIQRLDLALLIHT